MARLTSALFVSALIRRVVDSGGSAMLARRGSAEAGAVFITVWDQASREYELYEPEAAFEDTVEMIGGRCFRRHTMRFTEIELSDRVASEAKFDPDCWVIEIEQMPFDISELITLSSEAD